MQGLETAEFCGLANETMAFSWQIGGVWDSPKSERLRRGPLGDRPQADTAGQGEGQRHGQEAAIYVFIVDIVGLILIAIGIALVLKRPNRPAGAAPAEDDPGTYIRRIGGTVLATFGLALGLMVTLYHFAAAG